MKKLTAILFLLALIGNGYSNNQEIKLEFKNLIFHTLEYVELNPSHKLESEKILLKFQETLLKHGKAEFVIENKTEIETLFNWIYENGTSEYEDSPDLRRMKMRRALCFATIALNSDFIKAYTFIEYSKLSIIGDLEYPNAELLETEYLGILLIETMLKFDEKKLRISDLLKIKDYINVNKDFLNEKVILDTKSLITKCEKSINEKK